MKNGPGSSGKRQYYFICVLNPVWKKGYLQFLLLEPSVRGDEDL